MTPSVPPTARHAFAATRDRILATLTAPGDPSGASLHGAADLVVPIVGARVVLRIAPVDAPRAFARFRTVSIAYAVDGDLGRDADAARAALLALAARIEALDVEGAREEPTLDADFVRGASLSELIRPASARHTAALATWWRAGPTALAGLPPCLATELRPPFPRVALATPPHRLGAPCDTCGVAFACPKPRSADDHAAPNLRPLRHADDGAAVFTALGAIADAFGTRVPASVEAFVLDAFAARRGIASCAPTPFELSLKIERGRLVPSIRIVEYAPRAVDAADLGEVRAARASEVRRRASRFAPGERGVALEEWFTRVTGHDPRGVELSIGIDVPLAPLGEPALQVYAHVDPADRRACGALVADALAWSGVRSEAAAPIVRFLADAPGDAFPQLTLFAFSPTTVEPRRIKLYFAWPLGASHAASGLEAANLHPLAAFAPSIGLAVLETKGGTPRWRKHDFPNLAHYQEGRASVLAFGDGLEPAERSKLERLLDGERFAAWPTWLSVGRDGRTYYFVPR